MNNLVNQSESDNENLDAAKDIAKLLAPENPVRSVTVEGVGECIAYRRIIPCPEGESTAEYYVVTKEKIDKSIELGARVEWESIPRSKITKVGGALNPDQLFIAQVSALWRYEMNEKKTYNDCLGEAIGAVISLHGINGLEKIDKFSGNVNYLRKYSRAIRKAMLGWGDKGAPEIFRETDGNVVKRVIAISGSCSDQKNLRAVVVHELGDNKYFNLKILKGKSILFPETVAVSGAWLPMKGDEIKVPVSVSFNEDQVELGWITTVWGWPGMATEGKVSLCFVDNERFRLAYAVTNICPRAEEGEHDKLIDGAHLVGPFGLKGAVRAISINQATPAPSFKVAREAPASELTV